MEVGEPVARQVQLDQHAQVRGQGEAGKLAGLDDQPAEVCESVGKKAACKRIGAEVHRDEICQLARDGQVGEAVAFFL